MKKIVWCIFLSLFLVQTAAAKLPFSKQPDFFSLSATTTWREYKLAIPKLQFAKEKWAWACSLTLKSKQPLKLTNLVLQWRGEKIDKICAALYQKKEREKLVIPIQKNLISDGTWNPEKQQLIFSLNEKVIAVNKYHLFLSFPKQVEKKIRKGKFVILDSHALTICKKDT